VAEEEMVLDGTGSLHVWVIAQPALRVVSGIGTGKWELVWCFTAGWVGGGCFVV